jgi:hypothetical protein
MNKNNTRKTDIKQELDAEQKKDLLYIDVFGKN